MGRRRVDGPQAARLDMVALRPALRGASQVLGFVLEVAMLAAFLYWGFAQAAPWNLILGIALPAVVVVLWGAFLAPRSERFVGAQRALWAALLLFVAAAVALFSAGSAVLGILMLVGAVSHFSLARWLSDPK